MTINDQRNAIDQVRKSMVAAVNGSDADAASQLWMDDGHMMPPNHPTVHGRVAIRAHLANLFEHVQLQYTLSQGDLHIFADLAVERIDYHVDIRSLADGGTAEDSGKGLHVYQRQPDGRWLLSADIWNSNQ